jgi:cytochrome c553
MVDIAQAADVSPAVMTAAQKAALQKTIETCSACHGINGRSVAPTFPNLAAQSAPYIELQLHAFKDQTRADPDAQAYMWGMASQLDDASITRLAAYFSKQSAAEGKSGNATLIAQGKQIFVEGVPGRQIPGLRVLSWHPSPRQWAISAPRGAACSLSAQTAARDSKRTAYCAGDARCHQGLDGGPDASRRCVSGVCLMRVQTGKANDHDQKHYTARTRRSRSRCRIDYSGTDVCQLRGSRRVPVVGSKRSHGEGARLHTPIDEIRRKM